MSQDLLARRHELFGPGSTLFYQEPLHLVRGEGVWLFDDTDRRYLDMYNNVPCVGHANPRVTEAVCQQVGTLNVHSRYLHQGVLDYSERLLDLHADPLESVIFTCTGTEANEVAISLARIVTGKRGFVCTDDAYHGNSNEVMRFTHLRTRGHNPLGHGRKQEVRAIPFPQAYRPLTAGASGEELSQAYLEALKNQIQALEADGVGFAGMLVCPILANEGLPNIPGAFMRNAAEVVRESGGLMIVDEVQAGLCRTGKWWGYQHMDFEPDVVTMGKPMGNGVPVAATLARRDHVAAFRAERRYFNTFAASPLQAAAGSAVLDELETPGFRQRVDRVGQFLRQELRARMAECPSMGDVRGHGLFLGIEWIDPASGNAAPHPPDSAGAKIMVEHLKREGVLISEAGAYNNVLKFRPPLVFDQEHAEFFLEAFDRALEAYHAH